MISRTGIFLVAFLGFFSAVRSAMKCPGVAEYEVSFYGKWSNITHPNAYPVMAMGNFSTWVGASHNMNYKMWDAGMEASKGVEDVAESGNTTELEKEIDMRIMINKTAWKLIKAGGPTTGNGHAMGIKVEVTADYPMVSMISMLVPSPDWFAGIKGVNLCDNGTWLDAHNITNLQPWDAGTEDGNMFSTTNDPTDPQQNIAIITKDSDTPFKGDPIATLGMLMFKRVNKPTMSSCSGEQKYTLEFKGMWSKERQPLGFPDGAHFSRLIGCTHKYNYKFWSPMTMASPGVKDVAETGTPDVLYADLKAVMTKGGYVHQVYKADKVTESGTDSKTMEITVKDKYSMVSFISMLAPSPDWIVGVDSLDLCGKDGNWVETAEKSSPAYDAGTDSGTDFITSTDMPTMPQCVIKKITKDSDTVMMGMDAIKDFAVFKLTKYKADMSTPTPTPDSAQNPSAGVSVFLSVAFLVILRFLY